MTSKTQIKDFTRGSIPRQLIRFATPLFLSNLLQIVYNMVDMMVVGNVMGKEGTSAVSVGGDVSNLLTFVAMGFASAGQVIIARLIGGGERKKLARFVGTMVGFPLFFPNLRNIKAKTVRLLLKMQKNGNISRETVLRASVKRQQCPAQQVQAGIS